MELNSQPPIIQNQFTQIHIFGKIRHYILKEILCHVQRLLFWILEASMRTLSQKDSVHWAIIQKLHCLLQIYLFSKTAKALFSVADQVPFTTKKFLNSIQKS